MTKAWEFIWKIYHYYVGAPDAETAREYLKKKHPDIAKDAPEPMELSDGFRKKLRLLDGNVRSGREFNKGEM